MEYFSVKINKISLYDRHRLRKKTDILQKTIMYIVRCCLNKNICIF